MKSKILDCITFFDNNFMFNLRYNILKAHVDCFVICESKYDHKGNRKKIHFIMKNEYEKYLATKRQEIGMIWSRNVDEERKDAIALLKDATKTSFPSKWSCTDPL